MRPHLAELADAEARMKLSQTTFARARQLQDPVRDRPAGIGLREPPRGRRHGLSAGVVVTTRAASLSGWS